MKSISNTFTCSRLARGLLTFVSAAALFTSASAAIPEAPVIVSIDDEPVSPVPTPPPTSGTQVPLSWSDQAFAGVSSSGPLTLSAGQSRSKLSIDDSSGNSSILCNGACDLDHIRIDSREGVRCVRGAINLTWMWIEVTGSSGDHADGLQCYSPGSTGAVTVKNSTFKGTNANAGYFSADNWQGTHTFENVLFWGGNYGLRIPADGGSSVKLKNVYFVRGSFSFGPFLFDQISGRRISIEQWENVRWVTIENGSMVMGEEIPRPN